MGRDKAMLELGGKTLLARAVETLRRVEALRDAAGHVVVTIAGEREWLEGADRAIVDRYPECGPLGGIEAALADLNALRQLPSDAADWAFFIPVDMPLLTAGLMDGLLQRWAEAAAVPGQQARAYFAEVEGRPQPLVSLVHSSVHGMVREALEAGRYKVVPVLQSAGGRGTSVIQETERVSQDAATDAACSLPQPGESHVQFINVNTEADVIRVATLLHDLGSIT
jgi:molybdopterin-guanine dinucleotide biosynthesis protein A